MLRRRPLRGEVPNPRIPLRRGRSRPRSRPFAARPVASAVPFVTRLVHAVRHLSRFRRTLRADLIAPMRGAHNRGRAPGGTEGNGGARRSDHRDVELCEALADAFADLAADRPDQGAIWLYS